MRRLITAVAGLGLMLSIAAGAVNAGGPPAVGFYIDDVAYYTPANPFGPAVRFFDVEALEVLRGPQGTLYGQGAMGGTMIVRTAQPRLDGFDARARVVSSNMEEGDFKGVGQGRAL